MYHPGMFRTFTDPMPHAPHRSGGVFHPPVHFLGTVPWAPAQKRHEAVPRVATWPRAYCALSQVTCKGRAALMLWGELMLGGARKLS